MAQDNRVDFDSGDDFSKDLLKNVMEATELAKQRKAKDKAADAKLTSQSRDRKIAFAIGAVAGVIVIWLAYWVVFVRATTPPPPVVRKLPAPIVAPPQPYRPPAVQPRPLPRSEPVRRNPSETYDEGPGSGGGM